MSVANRIANRTIRKLGAAGAGRPVAFPALETVLLLVGTQQDFDHQPAALGRTADLARAARRGGLTVVYSTAAQPTPENGIRHPTPSQRELLARDALRPGAQGAAVHPDLAPVAEDIIMAPNAGVSAFAGGGLAARLSSLGACRVVIAGARTDVEVDSTARDSVELGFQTTVVADCCSGTSVAGHTSSLSTTLPRVVHRICSLDELQGSLG
jgi:nicotinamidase-related amidase